MTTQPKVLTDPKEIADYLEKSRQEHVSSGGYAAPDTAGALCRFEYCNYPAYQCPHPE